MVELGILLRSTIPALPALDLAEEAERRGFHSIWVTEGAYNQDAITQMTAMAMRTSVSWWLQASCQSTAEAPFLQG